MRNEFNKTTLVSNFVKQLVATSNLPIVSSWSPGQFVVEGLSYVSKDYILRALLTGTPKSYDDYDATKNEYYFEKVAPYVFNEKYDGITTNYISNSIDYDDQTHYYLGEYVRLYKMVNGIDLMPFYNCFGGKFVTNVDFTKGGKGLKFSGTSGSGYKMAVVPVKYNKTYTIGFNCPTRAEIVCCFFNGTKFLQKPTEALNKHITTYSVVCNTDITKPFVYTTPSWEQLITDSDVPVGQFERYFTLLIKLPATSTSAISVVEGDVRYATTYAFSVSGEYKRKTIRNYYPESIGVSYKPYEFNGLSPLSLFQYSGSQSLAFSNRLVEYLLLNVVSGADEITGNIKRVQDSIRMMPNSLYVQSTMVDGVWSDRMQEYCYNIATTSKDNKHPLDINGYVDKDVEFALR